MSDKRRTFFGARFSRSGTGKDCAVKKQSGKLPEFARSENRDDDLVQNASFSERDDESSLALLENDAKTTVVASTSLQNKDVRKNLDIRPDADLLRLPAMPNDGKDGPTPQQLSGSPKTTKHDILDITGGDGPWQRRIFFALLFISVPGAGQNLAITFMAPEQDFWCARPPGAHNVTVNEWKAVWLPQDDKHCSRYENVNLTFGKQAVNSTVIPCDSWEYDNSFHTSTIVSQWNLVCERQWLVSVAKSIFMFGLMVSVVVFGNLSDRYGRRPTIAGCCILMVISAVICAFSTSYIIFIVARFFVAMGVGGYYNNKFVLLMEVLDPKKRVMYGNLVQLGYSTGFVILPGVAWIFRDWFWLQIAITAPCTIFLGAWWMIPESPRWLLSKGRIAEARKALIKAAKINGKDLKDIEVILDNVIKEASEDFDSGKTEGNCLDLLRTPGLWQITINIFFSWFVVSFIYYGLSFNTNELAGDPYLNFAFSGAVEFPAYIFSILAIHRLGRRIPAGTTMLVSGLVCLASYFLPDDMQWLSVAFPMVGKLCITSCYGILHVFTLELLPTVVRNTGLGWACFFEEIGSIIAPFVRELGQYAGPVVPFIVFGVLAVASGVLVLSLPETSGRCVPDTLGEAAEVTRRDKDKTKNSV